MIEENKEVKQTIADYKPEVVHHPDLPQNNSSNLINAFLDNNTVEKFEQNGKVVQAEQNTDVLMKAETTAEFSKNSTKPTNNKLETLKKALYISISVFVVTLVIIGLALTNILDNILSVKGYTYFVSIIEGVYQASKMSVLGLSIAGTICLEGKDRKTAITALIGIIVFIIATPFISAAISSFLLSGFLG